jgi:hypothetical protein
LLGSSVLAAHAATVATVSQSAMSNSGMSNIVDPACGNPCYINWCT